MTSTSAPPSSLSSQQQHLPAGLSFVPVPFVKAEQPHAYWTLGRIAQVLGTGPALPHQLAGISTDTRSLRTGDCFVALVGDNFDGHSFLSAAKDRGAAAFVVSNPIAAAGLGIPTFVVDDTLIALGLLATAWRRAWGGPVISVAGSNGKTSTKDMLRAALGSTLTVHATAGNLNNLVGVPLTLLALPPHAELAVIEIGTNTPGEVAKLRAIVEADMAVLTSIGEEHLEGLGDLAGVLREETDVFQDVPLAIIPTAHPDVEPIARSRSARVIRAGLETGDVVPSAWGLAPDGTGWLTVDDVTVTLALRGAHQVANAALVVAAVKACGVPLERAAESLRTMPVPSMRGVWEEIGSAVLINDAYNANPASARAALDLLGSVGEGRQRVAVLGSMRELGAQADVQHDEVARAALASKADVIAAVGDFAAAFDRVAPGNARVIFAARFEDLWAQLEPRLKHDAVVLLKASRGARMERLVPFLTAWANQ
ncbi:MAG: UDP-N-acetylmuramoyl-tripeptide--D-alanyl-D-alanine ligase [Phycisphaerae bacterium]|nr:UDP-N-acetylmuramoyl-tripeptide--D-alanyl-D-alanine ligase [Gemmatimonadaceae bacterium]